MIAMNNNNEIATLVERMEYAWNMYMQSDEYSDESEMWFNEWKSLNDLICDIEDGSVWDDLSNSEVRYLEEYYS